MTKKNLLFVAALLLLVPGQAVFVAAQHEGHRQKASSPRRNDSQTKLRAKATPCQKAERLADELEQSLNSLADVSDLSELQKRLAGERAKLEELRSVLELCSEPGEEQRSQKGCGHSGTHH